MYSEIGSYSKAEPLYLKVMDIMLKVVGNNHPQYAASVSKVG